MTLPYRRGVTRRALAVVAVVAVTLTPLAACSFGRGGPEPSPVGSAAAPPSSVSASPAPGQVVAPSSDPAKDPAYGRFYGQKPTWRDCEGGFECTQVAVPLDWSAPQGETIELAMIRSTGKGTLGSLFFNPGGPGVPGVSFLRQSASSYGEAIRSAYRLVSWDTRGVGESDPAVTCLPNQELDAFYAADATPDNATETTELVRDLRRYVQSCQKNSGALVEHLDTISTVKDMDVMRAVVGDDVLNFFGASYGTYLGAWYAQLFPWRVGRLVLDGAIDPSLTSAQYAEGQALGFSRAVRAFVDDCLRRKDCPLRGTRDDAYRQLERLLARIDERPLRTEDPKRPLTQALFSTGLLQGMYATSLWPAVSTGLADALRGNGSTMLALADLYLERDEQGKYGQTLQVNGPIYCQDHPETRSVEQIAADAQRLQRKYPPFGDIIGWSAVGCALSPRDNPVPAQKLTAQGARPILVVGSTDDPATPYEWSKALASQLSSGRLLTRVGQGHTAYGQGDKCIDAAIEGFLVSGTLPAEDTRCG